MENVDEVEHHTEVVAVEAKQATKFVVTVVVEVIM